MSNEEFELLTHVFESEVNPCQEDQIERYLEQAGAYGQN